MKRSPIHQQLYESTHDLHDRLDSHPLLTRLFSPELDQADYIRVMCAMRRALVPLEDKLLGWEAQHGHGALPAYQPRLPALEADLASLGVTQFSSPCVIWHPDCLATHAGARYVLDGACQGSVPILRCLNTHECLSGHLGFWQLQAQLAGLWPDVTRGLEAMELDPEARLVAVESARGVFEIYLQAMNQ